jgi:hypothetical protein
MANPWFRLYSEFEDDPKVEMLPEVIQLRFVKLLCERCKEQTRTDRQRAFKWRIDLDALAQTKAALIEAGFIDENWTILNWDKRQFLSDSSTERTRRYRQKRRETSRERHGDVNSVSHVTKRGGLDADADSEQNRLRAEAESANARLLAKRNTVKSASPVPVNSIFSSQYPRPTFSTLPQNRTAMVLAGFHFSNKAACKGCGAEIEWWTSPKGSALPFDAMAAGDDAAVNHLESCAKGAEFRRAN